MAAAAPASYQSPTRTGTAEPSRRRGSAREMGVVEPAEARDLMGLVAEVWNQHPTDRAGGSYP